MDDNPKKSFDCEVFLSTEFANRVLHAASYPLRLQLRDDGSPTLDTEEVAADQTAGREAGPEVSESDAAEELQAVIEDVWSPSSLSEQAAAADSTAPIQKNKRCKAEVTALTVTLLQPPEVQLANPVLLTGIPLEIDATIKLSVRLLGRWRTFTIRLPNLKLHGKQAQLHISTSAQELTLTPEFDNLDLAVGLNILKWKFGYRFGITRYVNQRLPKKHLPLQRLLNAAELPDVFSTPPEFDRVDFMSTDKGLRIGADFLVDKKTRDADCER